MSRKDLKIVEPVTTSNVQSEAEEFFRAAGWEEADVPWIAAVCLKHQPIKFDPEDGLTHSVEHNLQRLAASWNEVGPTSRRNAALLRIFVRLCECGDTGGGLWRTPGISEPAYRTGLTEWKAIAQEMRQARPGRPEVDFEAALVTDGWPGQYGHDQNLQTSLSRHARQVAAGYRERDAFIDMIEALVCAADVDLSRVLDVRGLLERGRWVSPEPSPQDGRWSERSPSGIGQVAPTDLDPWLFVLGPQVLEHLEPFVFERSADEAVTLSLGIRDSLERWCFFGCGYWTHGDRIPPQHGPAILRFADRLESLVQTQKPPVGSRLRKAWLWYSLGAFQIPGQYPTAERREFLIRSATEEVAHLRKIFCRAKPDEQRSDANVTTSTLSPRERTAAEEYSWHAEHFRDCAFLIESLGGAWRLMKPMLLAVRSLTAPCVSKDLRYWDEKGLEPVPQPWSDVPKCLINVFLNRVHRAKSSDPELASLRANFARFCLDRLLDRWKKAERDEADKIERARRDEDMVEPSEYWRYCYVRAISALAINPEGIGHRILHRSSEIDPSPKVREASRDAYERIRRGKGLDADASPVRAVLSALWWIRQGHLLGLGIQPDPDGAQRTRKKELSRTGKED